MEPSPMTRNPMVFKPTTPAAAPQEPQITAPVVEAPRQAEPKANPFVQEAPRAAPSVDFQPMPTPEPVVIKTPEPAVFKEEPAAHQEVKLEGATAERESLTAPPSPIDLEDDSDFFDFSGSHENPPLEKLMDQQEEAPVEQEPVQFEELSMASHEDDVLKEAAELAGQIKAEKTEKKDGATDELDVPAFLRNGLKDLSLL
jgi:hypothetical protein